MKIRKLEVTIKNNLDEYAQLVKEAQEAIKRVNDFELEFEIVKEDKNKKVVYRNIDGEKLAKASVEFTERGIVINRLKGEHL